MEIIMNYFLNKNGYPQADIKYLRFMRFDDNRFDKVIIKTYSKRGFLKNYGLVDMKKAKSIWGEKFIILAFIRDEQLNVILEA